MADTHTSATTNLSGDISKDKRNPAGTYSPNIYNDGANTLPTKPTITGNNGLYGNIDASLNPNYAKGSNKNNEVSTTDTTDQPSTDYYGSSGYYGYGSSGGSLSDEKSKAADRTRALANFNAQNSIDRFADKVDYYNKANQNAKDTFAAQNIQDKQSSNTNRYEAYRNDMLAAMSNRNRMDQALNSSAADNLLLAHRLKNDEHSNKLSQELRSNLNANMNDLVNTLNQNALSQESDRIDLIRDLTNQEASLAADLANIDPDLFELPGENSSINFINRNSHGVPETSTLPSFAEQAGITSSGYGGLTEPTTGADPFRLALQLQTPTVADYLYNSDEGDKLRQNRIFGGYNGYRR